jgi:hypothetical protein
MRKLALFGCSILAASAVAATAGAASSVNGSLSVHDGRGVVVLELRGNVLGRVGRGTLRVTDYTPRDPFSEVVIGRDVIEEQRGPRTTLYRGQGLRFRMLGGAFRMVVRGYGIDISAVGRGVVVLDGEKEKKGDDSTGLYSVAGVDCGAQPVSCFPLPEEPQRFFLGAPD